MTPTTDPAKRIATLFGRRLTTSWNIKEVKAYKALVKMGCFESTDDLNLLERYYFSERKKGDKGIHRRDLYTLLNNWHSELDRAREWNARLTNTRSLTKEKKSLTNNGATEEDYKRAGELARAEIVRLRAQLGMK